MTILLSNKILWFSHRSSSFENTCHCICLMISLYFCCMEWMITQESARELWLICQKEWAWTSGLLAPWLQFLPLLLSWSCTSKFLNSQYIFLVGLVVVSEVHFFFFSFYIVLGFTGSLQLSAIIKMFSCTVTATCWFALFIVECIMCSTF